MGWDLWDLALSMGNLRAAPLDFGVFGAEFYLELALLLS